MAQFFYPRSQKTIWMKDMTGEEFFGPFLNDSCVKVYFPPWLFQGCIQH